nr:energy transducer TonB [Bacillota bacterium]
MERNKDRLLASHEAPMWSWRVVILSLVFTLALFLSLPFSEMVSKEENRSELSLRRVDTATLFQPPPPPKASRPRQPKPAKSKLPKPKLVQTPQQLAPLQIALGLDLGDVGGDFSLDLSLVPKFQPQLSVEEMVFELSEVDQPPRPLVKVPPLYPLSARAKGIEGNVVLVFVVQADGSVSDIEVEESFPGKIFVDAALRAVRQWRFKPGTKDGQPVATRVRLPVRFQLED